MTPILFFAAVAASIITAIIGLSFLISCIWEKESRAALFAALQFLLMLGLAILLFYLGAVGFFETGTGSTVLILGLVLSGGLLALLTLKIGSNLKALQGTRGLMVGSVKPYDERDIVFARNRALSPGSEPYKAYYQLHPEHEEYDAARRKKGGPLGKPGSIDKPEERPNVAATLASLSIPLHLSTPEKFNPSQHPEFSQQRVEISPESAGARIKGYTLSIGAKLVGITEINPLWIYSKLIRALISRNRYSRQLFNLMDDIFYGKKPKPKAAPEWASYS